MIGKVSTGGFVDAVERAMDAAGFDAAHLVGNSLGGYLALRPEAGRWATVPMRVSSRLSGCFRSR